MYEFPSGKLKREITVGPDPSEITVCYDGKYAAIACGESSFVTFIDLNTKTKVKDVKVDPYPSNVWIGFGSKIFVENKIKKSLNLLDIDKLKAVEFIDFDFTPGISVYNPKSKEIWTTSHSSPNLHIYKSESNGKWTKQFTLDLETNVYTFSFYDNYSKALCLSREDSQILIIDTLTRKVIGTFKAGSKPNGLVLL